MKYKVGDKVRVRKDILTDKRYGRWVFVEGMCHLIGGVVSINEVLEDSYHIDEEICYIKNSYSARDKYMIYYHMLKYDIKKK